MHSHTLAKKADFLEGLPTISLEEFRRRQAEYDLQRWTLTQLHLSQLLQAMRNDAALEGWWSSWTTELLIWATYRHLERIADARAGLALHHWAWLDEEEEAPGLAIHSRALQSAQGALVGAPARGQALFQQPLALALLSVLAPAAPAGATPETVNNMTPSTAADAPRDASLYQQVLRCRFQLLAEPVRRFHSLEGLTFLQGHVRLEAPTNAPARWLAAGLGLPRHRVEGVLHFELQASTQAEQWTRHFPGHSTVSKMRVVDGQLEERMGLVRLTFTLDVTEGGALEMKLVRMRCLGVPVPRWLRPKVLARETGRDGQLHFQVQASMLLVGTVASYEGYLQVQEPTAAPAEGQTCS